VHTKAESDVLQKAEKIILKVTENARQKFLEYITIFEAI